MNSHDPDTEIEINLRRSKRLSTQDEILQVVPKKYKKQKQTESDVSYNDSNSTNVNSDKGSDLNNSVSDNPISSNTSGNKFLRKVDKINKCSPCKNSDKNILEDNKICENCKDNSISSDNKMIGCLVCMKYLHVNCLLTSDLPPNLIFNEGQFLRRKLRCMRCEVIHLCYKVDIIVTWRWRKEALTVDKPEKYYMPREFLVHYIDMSYWDCEWVPEVQLEISETFLYRAYKRRFLDFTIPPPLNKISDTKKNKLSQNEQMLYDKYVQWGIDSEWLQPEKVLKMDDVGCFVKWRNLGYEFVSTEPLTRVNEIDGLQAAIDRYIHLANEMTGVTWVSKKKSTLTKLSESPSYLCPSVSKDKTKPMLFPYQLEGLNWLRSCYSNNINTILADEMGLGKTIQAISLLYSLYKDGVCNGPFIITVPLSTIKNWEREFEFWAPDMCVLSYYGDRETRKIIRDKEMYHGKKDIVTFHVLLTTYELIMYDDSFLIHIKWEILIVDEAHRLKNNEAKLFKSLKKYKIKWRLLMTGTPLQNNLEELFHLLNFMEPASFRDLNGFLSRFADISKEEQVRTLQEMLKTHILRRLKSDVFSDLPTKEEQIILVELTEYQKKLYKLVLARNYMVLSGNGYTGIKLMNIMMQLRKCCNHPYLLTPYLITENLIIDGNYDGPALIAASGKMAILHPMLMRLRETGHKVLIFSGMTRLLDIMECMLEHMGIQFERIDGRVSSVSRQNAIDRFNDPESTTMVFLLSTRAGGLGINLSSADTVFIYDADWNPHSDIQALSRAHRIGQTRKVMIYRFVTRNTVEEKIMDTAKRKMVMTNLVVKSFTKLEFHQIISFGTKELFDDNNDQNHQTIVYDDAAIEQLLDRTRPEPTNSDNNFVDSWFSGFKVAEYQFASESAVPAVTTEDEQSKCDVPTDESAIAAVAAVDMEITNPAEYWKTLLESVVADEIIKPDSSKKPPSEAAAAAPMLGKGLRKHKDVNYIYGRRNSKANRKRDQVVDSRARDPDDTDYDISEGQSAGVDDRSDYEYDHELDNGEEDDDFDIEDEDDDCVIIGQVDRPKYEAKYNFDRDMLKLTKHGMTKGNLGLTGANDMLPPPVIRFEHFSVVAGFMPRERMEIYCALMNYGLPGSVLKKGDIWWPSALNHKTPDELDRFLGTFMAALYDCYNVSPSRTDNDILRDEIDYDLLLMRIGINALINYKVNQYESSNRTILEIVTYKNWNISTISIDELSCLFDDLRYIDFDFNIFDGGFSSIHRLWEEYRSSTTVVCASPSLSEPGQKRNPTLKWNKLHDYYLLSAIASHGYDRFIDAIFQDPQYQIIFIPARLDNLDLVKDNAKIRKLIRDRQKILEDALLLEAQIIKIGTTVDGYSEGLSSERLAYYSDLFENQDNNHFVTLAFANTKNKLAAVTQLELLINDIDSGSISFKPISVSDSTKPS